MRISPELRNRTKAFSSLVIRLYIALPLKRVEVAVLGEQLLRSGTSVAAHSRAASRTYSSTEFCSKLDVLLQGADESMLWLEHLKEDCGISSSQIEPVHQECCELIAIFTSIVAKVRRK